MLFAFICSLMMGTSFAAHGVPGSNSVTYTPDVTFTLRTNIANGKLVFVGDAGAIKGKVNPDLQVPEGAVVQINLVNDDGAVHDIAVPDFNAKSDQISG
jgi:nitrite reductase (NO-forming)